MFLKDFRHSGYGYIFCRTWGKLRDLIFYLHNSWKIIVLTSNKPLLSKLLLSSIIELIFYQFLKQVDSFHLLNLTWIILYWRKKNLTLSRKVGNRKFNARREISEKFFWFNCYWYGIIQLLLFLRLKRWFNYNIVQYCTLSVILTS